MKGLTFNQEWMDEYWSNLSPEILTSLKNYESLEKWTINYQEHLSALDSLNKLATSLPAVANLPLDDEAEIHASALLQILCWLPMRSAVAATGWLIALSQSEPSWGYALYLYSVQILKHKERFSEVEQVNASIFVQRLEVTNCIKAFGKIYLQHESLRELMHELSVKLDYTTGL